MKKQIEIIKNWYLTYRDEINGVVGIMMLIGVGYFCLYCINNGIQYSRVLG